MSTLAPLVKPHGPPRALVIEETRELRERLCEHLRSAGLERVEDTDDPALALSDFELSPDRFQLLLVTLEMSRMDGLELLRHLAACRCSAALVLLSDCDQRLLRTVELLVRVHGLRLLGVLSTTFQEHELRTVLSPLWHGSPGPRPRKTLHPLSPEALHAGIEQGCVTAWFQPVVSMQDRRIIAAEALARWKDPERGVLAPDVFLPGAEQEGLGRAITHAVLREAFTALREWHESGFHLRLAVNLSTADLTDETLPNVLSDGMCHVGATTEHLVLELAEGGFPTPPSPACDTLLRLCVHGHQLSIDDFGTRFSTLEDLRVLPFTELKLDRALVSGIAEDPVAQSIVRSCVELSRKLDARVVAKGIESELEHTTVASLGVDAAQGYLHGAPMPREQLLQMLSAHA